ERITTTARLFRLGHRLHVDTEFAVGLIGQVFPVAGRPNGDHTGFTIHARIYVAHRRGKVRHLQPPTLLIGNGGPHETHLDAAALFTHIHRDRRVGEVDDNTAFARFTATKINLADLVATARRRLLLIGARLEDIGRLAVHAQCEHQLVTF